jgi:anti-anti-sigma regulatory factor
MHVQMKTFNGETALLRVSGRIESRLDTEKLKRILKGFGNGEYREVVINVSEVEYFHERAIDLLVEALTRSSAMTALQATQTPRKNFNDLRRGNPALAAIPVAG